MALQCAGRGRVMVKVGFICEGATEQILLQSDSFRNLLSSLNLESLQIIDAKGAGNLLPHNIEGYVTRLEKEGAKVIVILTDLRQGAGYCCCCCKNDRGLVFGM
jgi:hypothetical protein